jgi:PIN domain nuclease of toxin-antitoxin system
MPAPSLLLDTHVFIWFAIGENLPSSIVKMIEKAQKDSKVFLSDISSWETSMLAMKNRISISSDPLVWIKEAISKMGVQMLRLLPEVVVDSCRLPNWEHKDPADRIITATARYHDLTIVTADKKIIDYGKTGNVNVHSFKKLGDK